MLAMELCIFCINSSGTSDAIWRRRSGSTLAIIIVHLVYKIALEWDGSLSDRMIWLPVNCPWLIAYYDANDYCVKGSFCVRAGTAGDGVTCNVVSRWLGPHTEWPLVLLLPARMAWGPPGVLLAPGGSHVGPMRLAIRVRLAQWASFCYCYVPRSFAHKLYNDHICICHQCTSIICSQTL